MADGNWLKTFGNGGAYLYTFPTTQSQVRDNFSDVVPRTVRVPGANGGFDQFGLDPAPTEIGNVAVTFDIEVADPDLMQAERDEIRAMAAWGVQKLIKQCGDEGERYCWARVNSIGMTESPAGSQGSISTNILLRVTVDFQVAEPGWFDDTAWDTPTSLTTLDATTGNPTQTEVTIGGLFPVFPRFTVTIDSAFVTDVGLYISQTTPTTLTGIADCQFYMQAISTPAGTQSSLVIDCASMSVQHNGADAFAEVDYYANANYFSLPPGTYYVKAFVKRGGATGFLSMQWREKY